jgi:uncharacterized SAM-dependent methyltransferase
MNEMMPLSEEALERRLKRHLDRRELPDSFLYVGTQGARNWLALESSEGFPVASALTTLLREHVDAIAQRVGHCRDVVSIGAGDGHKEGILLEAMSHVACPLCHVIDVSRPMVDAAVAHLRSLKIEARGVTAFCEDMDALSPWWDRPVLLCLLGNNFCNYEPSELLSLVGRNLGSDDSFLFDCSLLPADSAQAEQWLRGVETIYNSPDNVRFNTAPLVARGMNPAGYRFELGLITVDSPWGPVYRTRKRIHILERATVRCGPDPVTFQSGEAIEMGFTYKYRLPQLRGFLEANGFGISASWSDAAGGNVMILARKRTAEVEP